MKEVIGSSHGVLFLNYQKLSGYIQRFKMLYDAMQSYYDILFLLYNFISLIDFYINGYLLIFII